MGMEEGREGGREDVAIIQHCRFVCQVYKFSEARAMLRVLNTICVYLGSAVSVDKKDEAGRRILTRFVLKPKIKILLAYTDCTSAIYRQSVCVGTTDFNYERTKIQITVFFFLTC